MGYLISKNLSAKDAYLSQALRKSKPNASSRFRGVTLNKKTQKWYAALTYMGRRYYLGVHGNEIDAAKAYNQKALEVIGSYAILNEITENDC